MSILFNVEQVTDASKVCLMVRFENRIIIYLMLV